MSVALFTIPSKCDLSPKIKVDPLVRSREPTKSNAVVSTALDWKKCLNSSLVSLEYILDEHFKTTVENRSKSSTYFPALYSRTKHLQRSCKLPDGISSIP
ncbi:hypothetical protein TcCL_ESM02785 [Trypanosoma cruzi]|nr:hypothetical protein TcCL_ESM02785 [Trypanosoma cruzi]